MAAPPASSLLLLAIFAISIVALVASGKYIAWAAPQTVSSYFIPLIFYAGAMPVASLVQSIIHIAVLHLEAIMPLSFTTFITVLQMLGWLVTGTIWTTCESSSSPIAGLCPQHMMVDNGKVGLMGLSIFKDIVAWVLVFCYSAMLALTIRAILDLRNDPWKRRDEFFELAEYDKQRGLT